MELAHSQRAMEYVNYLMTKHGYNLYAASAAIGHSIQESRLNPGSKAEDGSGSRALMQWLGSRKTRLLAYARQQHADWRDPSVQLDFFAHENNTPEKYGGEKSVGDRLKRARSFEEASKAMMDYLRPRGYKTWAPTRGHAWSKRMANTLAVGRAYMAMQQQAPTQVAAATHRYHVADRHMGRVAQRYAQRQLVYHQMAMAPSPVYATRFAALL